MKLRHWLLVLLMKYLLTCTLGVAFMTTATYSDRGKFFEIYYLWIKFVFYRLN